MTRAVSILAVLALILVGGPAGAVATPPQEDQTSSTEQVSTTPAADDTLDDVGDIAAVGGTLIALGGLIQVIRRTAKESKDLRVRELLTWSANTGVVLQEASAPFSDKSPINATATDLRELSENSRALAAILATQANAMVMLPKDAPPPEDLPHHMSILERELRLLSSEALRTCSECAEAERPNPSLDAIAEQWHTQASEGCSKGRELIGKRLASVTETATEALSQFNRWVGEMKAIDNAARGRLLRLASKLR